MEKCLHIIPRKIAKERGLKRYFTGKACPSNHIVERFTSSSGCVDCQYEKRDEWRSKNRLWEKERNSEWYEKNKEMHLERGKEWRENNKERRKKTQRLHYIKNKNRISRYHAKWYKENRDRVLRGQADYRKSNPEKTRLRSAKRRSREMSAEGTYAATDIQNLLTAQNHKCASCRCSLKKTGYHVDHIQPLAKGGTNWPDNLQILCPSCNLSKGAKDPVQWAQENGRLL